MGAEQHFSDTLASSLEEAIDRGPIAADDPRRGQHRVVEDGWPSTDMSADNPILVCSKDSTHTWRGEKGSICPKCGEAPVEILAAEQSEAGES